MSSRLLMGTLRILRRRLAYVSRANPDYRAALSRDVCIHLSTGDGVSMRFVVRDRRFVADDSEAPADLALRFRTATDALAFLLSPDPLARMIDGQTSPNITLSGNAILLLWFQGRILQALPFSRLHRRRISLPGSVTAPIARSRTRRQVERLPVTDELDPDWHSALTAREQIYMYQVAHGKRPVPY